MKYEATRFINTLYHAMHDYTLRESESSPVKANRSYLRKIIISLYGIWDFILLLCLRNKISKKQFSIYYTHSSFVKIINNDFEDILFNEILKLDNSIFINYDKFSYIKNINGIRVYNVGIIVKLISKLNVVRKRTKLQNYN